MLTSCITRPLLARENHTVPKVLASFNVAGRRDEAAATSEQEPILEECVFMEGISEETEREKKKKGRTDMEKMREKDRERERWEECSKEEQ